MNPLDRPPIRAAAGAIIGAVWIAPILRLTLGLPMPVAVALGIAAIAALGYWTASRGVARG